jgi:hypothetical protein
MLLINSVLFTHFKAHSNKVGCICGYVNLSGILSNNAISPISKLGNSPSISISA